jgi:hypothetical protein
MGAYHVHRWAFKGRKDRCGPLRQPTVGSMAFEVAAIGHRQVPLSTLIEGVRAVVGAKADRPSVILF